MSKRHAIKSSSKRYFDLRSWWILEFQSFFSLLWHKCIWNRGRSTVAAFRPFFCQSWNSTHYSVWSNQHLILFNIKHDFLLRRLFKRGFVVILFFICSLWRIHREFHLKKLDSSISVVSNHLFRRRICNVFFDLFLEHN